MKNTKKRGKFIVMEGIDGSGKTTQLKMLSEYLTEKGEKVVVTAEPSPSPFGVLLRSCLKREVEANEFAIAALFAADRMQHISEIKKLLDEGTTVLCDRYYFSSFAYNGGFVPLDWVVKLNEQAMKELPPDLTVYIDLTPEECMRRIEARAEAKERYEDIEKQRVIRENYFSAFKRFPNERVAVVESTEKAITQAEIRKAVDALEI